jgi:hypothetical protein
MSGAETERALGVFSKERTPWPTAHQHPLYVPHGRITKFAASCHTRRSAVDRALREGTRCADAASSMKLGFGTVAG